MGNWYLQLVVLWLITMSVYFSLYLRGVNFYCFMHAFKRLSKSSGNVKGEISPFGALMVALSGSVGLGNIAGTALGICIGGPGVLFWMLMAGLLAMCLKFAEITAAHRYRYTATDGRVIGGSFAYIRLSLVRLGCPKFGAMLAIVYAGLLVCASSTGGNMFQANQLVSALVDRYPLIQEGHRLYLSLAVCLIASAFVCGGLKILTRLLSAVLPTLSVCYLLLSLVVIYFYRDQLLPSLHLIWSDAWTGRATGVGMIAVIVIGMQRAFFANLAGFGISTVIHASAKAEMPAEEGCVGMLEPFLDTTIICAVCGLVVIVSGSYLQYPLDEVLRYGGVIVVNAAYESVSLPVAYLLNIIVVCMALSVIAAMSYVVRVGWEYCLGARTLLLCKVIFPTVTFFGGMMECSSVLHVADILTLSLAFPNIVALFLMRDIVLLEKNRYVTAIAEKATSLRKGQNNNALSSDTTMSP